MLTVELQPTKVCPVVVRGVGKTSRVSETLEVTERREILAFRHPQAGLQLVKGTIEPHESPAAAAVRELAEEAGVVGATVVRFLGVWPAGYENHIWAFYQLAPAGPLPETWHHFTSDGGGHLFHFFWHSLDALPDDQWHPVFARALDYVRARLP